MKKLILIVAIVIIFSGWFFMRSRGADIQNDFGPTPVSVREAVVGDRIGAFTLETLRVFPESGTGIDSIHAEFAGAVTIDVDCGYYDDIMEYTCKPTGESIQAVPMFSEINGQETPAFSIFGSVSDIGAFGLFREIIDSRKGAEGYSVEPTPLRIIIADYRIRYGAAKFGPSAGLLDVIE